MSRGERATRGALFLALALALPLPLFGLEGSFVPLARFAQLGGALALLVATEGAGGMVGALLALLWGHVLVYGGVGVLASRWLARGLHAGVPVPARPWIAAGLVAGLLLWGELGRPYDTLFHHSEAHASLLSLYR